MGEGMGVLLGVRHPKMKKPAKKAGFVILAHSEGFEPSTARFVAEYSIQLSYECKI